MEHIKEETEKQGRIKKKRVLKKLIWCFARAHVTTGGAYSRSTMPLGAHLTSGRADAGGHEHTPADPTGGEGRTAVLCGCSPARTSLSRYLLDKNRAWSQL